MSAFVRCMIVIQLCLAFTALSSYAGYPFMTELFEIKSKQQLFQAVKGGGCEVSSSLFLSLSKEEKEKIEKGYDELQKRLQEPFLSKIRRMCRILIKDCPPFVKAWIVFSIVIALCLLLRIEGANHAAWLLPLIALAYSVDTTFHGTRSNKNSSLFPSEKTIVDKYLQEPLKSSLWQQREQLMKGFHIYLIKEWAKEEPSDDLLMRETQVKKGQFYFNLKRIAFLEPLRGAREHFRQSPSFGVILLYLVWNLFFAYCVGKKEEQRLSRVIANSHGIYG